MRVAATRASAPASPVEGKGLRITEIFRSIQGESSLAGWPTVFVRLTGCPLRCQYCDTAYAFHGGQVLPLSDILETVRNLGCRYVCVTGGEPLAQPSCTTLLESLCDAGYVVSLETSGAMDVSRVDARVRRIIDIKTPGSGEAHRNLWSNFSDLRAHDEIKFVICSREDYEWAVARERELSLARRATVLFSPSAGQVEPRDLASWILADGVPARFQVQLHKYLWGNEPGR